MKPTIRCNFNNQKGWQYVTLFQIGWIHDDCCTGLDINLFGFDVFLGAT